MAVDIIGGSWSGITLAPQWCGDQEPHHEHTPDWRGDAYPCPGFPPIKASNSLETRAPDWKQEPMTEDGRRPAAPEASATQPAPELPQLPLGYGYVGMSPDGIPVIEQTIGDNALYILHQLLPEVAERMVVSAQHYGDELPKVLGLKGQYADIYRKVGPLKRQMWDGLPSTRESTREILMDLIGHCLLSVRMIDEEDASRTPR